MRNLFIRFFINALALWGAGALLEGVELSEEFTGVLVVALVFGLVNALIKPIVTLLTLPLIVLTLGLLTLVINAGMLWLTSSLTRHLDLAGFWSAVLGALVISVASFPLSVLLTERKTRTAD